MPSIQAPTVSPAYPLGSRVSESGRLQIGGCDALELAREFGTPAYIVAEEDLRARARAFRAAMSARHGDDFDVLFASKAFPATAVFRVFAEEDLGCDVASGGELNLALRGGFDPRRIYLHGNAKSRAELEDALRAGVGHIVLDGPDDVHRVEEIAAATGVRQPVLLRVTPGVHPDTHAAMATGQRDSKFGFALDEAPLIMERVAAAEHLDLVGLHMHIGSQIFALEPYRAAMAALAELGDFPLYNLGGGLAVAYTAEDAPPSIEDYVEAKVSAAHAVLGPGKRLILEPGRSLVANSTVTLYTVESVKRGDPTYVAVDGGMSDNLRPMLYEAVYEASVADRFGAGEPVRLVGKHCESGDVIVRDAALVDPRPGDTVVTPATGAYGHSLANNYNGLPRPPVVFCADGDARVVVRRETYDDLAARDV